MTQADVDKPVQCSDGFFWRQGAVSQKLTRNEIRDFFQVEGVIRFDLSPCPRFRYPEDFDPDKYRAWLKLSGISGSPDVRDVLVNTDTAEHANGTLLFRNAGVLFFAKNVRRFFSQAYVTCLLAKGSDKVHILDRKDFDGGIVAPRLVHSRSQRLCGTLCRSHRGGEPRKPAQGNRSGRLGPWQCPAKRPDRRPAPPHRLHRKGWHRDPSHP